METPDLSAASGEERLEVAIGLLHDGGPDAVPAPLREAVLEEETRRLSHPDSGLEYYALNYAMIRVKGEGWQRFCPDGKPRVDDRTGRDWSWQPQLWRQLTKFYVLLIIKSRQLGLTWSCALVAQWEAQWHGLRAAQVVAVVADKLASSKRIMRRARDMYRRQPTWLNALSPLDNDGVMRMEYENGSSIEPFAGTPDASAGEDATVVLVEEVGRIKHLPDVWAGLEACADSGGRIIMWGTANARESGVGSALHQWCVDTASGSIVTEIEQPEPDGSKRLIPIWQGETDMAFCFLPWYLNAARDERWYQRKRRLYKGNLSKFDSEYPLKWEDAFIGAGTAWFDYEALRTQQVALEAEDEKGDPLFMRRDRRGTFVWVNRDRNHVKFIEDPYGDVTLHFNDDEYASIMAARMPFVISADCRGDGEPGDYNAAHCIRTGRVPKHEDDTVEQRDLLPFEQFATIHGHMDADQYGEQLVRMGWYFGGALISVEMNGVGVATSQTVKRLGYPFVYSRRSKKDSRHDRPTKLIGWYSTPSAKHVAYDETERLLRNGWLILRDVGTISECINIRRLAGGAIGAPEGKFDDRADGLAIACVTAPDAHHFDHSMSIDPALLDELAIDDILDEIEREKRSANYLGHRQSGILSEV